MSSARHSIKIVNDTEDYTKEPEIETVSVILMKSMVVKVRGEITNNEYIFNGAGSIVQVDKKDIDGMMKNNIRRQSCCGSYSTPYFSLV
jgi:hypothetical protein